MNYQFLCKLQEITRWECFAVGNACGDNGKFTRNEFCNCTCAQLWRRELCRSADTRFMCDFRNIAPALKPRMQLTPRERQRVWENNRKRACPAIKSFDKCSLASVTGANGKKCHDLSAPDRKKNASDWNRRSRIAGVTPIAVLGGSNCRSKPRDLWFEPLFQLLLESQHHFLVQQVSAMSFSEMVRAVSNR